MCGPQSQTTWPLLSALYHHCNAVHLPKPSSLLYRSHGRRKISPSWPDCWHLETGRIALCLETLTRLRGRGLACFAILLMVRLASFFEIESSSTSTSSHEDGCEWPCCPNSESHTGPYFCRPMRACVRTSGLAFVRAVGCAGQCKSALWRPQSAARLPLFWGALMPEFS